MGGFRYNNPLIAFLVKIANMMIVSFYWVVCCIPVVTILPATAALFHSVNKVVFGGGSGLTRDFFTALKGAWRPGWALSLLVAAMGGLLYLGIHSALQLWRSGVFGAVYMAVGVLIALVLLPAVIYIGPVLAKFEGGVNMVLRLSLYLSARKLWQSIWFVLLLAAAVAAIDFFPLLLLIVPALYVDLIRGGVNRRIREYMEANGLSEPDEEAPAAEPAAEELGAKALDRMLSEDDAGESGETKP